MKTSPTTLSATVLIFIFGSLCPALAQERDLGQIVEPRVLSVTIGGQAYDFQQLLSPPASGTFWSIRTNLPPIPFAPPGLDVFEWKDGTLFYDDTAFDYTQKRTRDGSAQRSSENENGPPPPGEGEEGNDDPVESSPAYNYTTNDLWLEIVSVTNDTAYFTVHTPDTNGVYDLFNTTNLTETVSGLNLTNWVWLLRSYPGQKNLIVPNATELQSFYRIGSPNDITAKSSLGTNFWVEFFNMYYHANINLSLYISSPVGAIGTVIIPGLGVTNNFAVAAQAVTKIDIPRASMMTTYDVVETKGIQITASQSISVYGVEFDPAASAAFTAYPTHLLGTNYCVITYGTNQFAIVATANNTTVTIVPSPTANLAGHSGTNAYTKVLQQGQTYQIKGGDVTGTRITANQPLGVFAGAQLGNIPSGELFGNPLVQEQLAVESWGAQALALSFAGRTNGDSYRVLAANNDTMITIISTNGVIVVTNQAGGFYQTILDGPVEFRSNQPIQVAQFANGWSFDGARDEAGQAKGDPCEILLLPTGHYLKTNIVFTLPYGDISSGFHENYLNIIVAQSAITNTFVDDLTVAATNFVAIGNSGYYGARLSVTNSGVHTVISSQPVGVQVYGFGPYDAYGYFGGTVK